MNTEVPTLDFSKKQNSKTLAKNYQIGFFGAGNMAQALAKGLINSGYVSAEQIYAFAPSNSNAKIFKDLGCHFTNQSMNLFPNSTEPEQEIIRIIFICVKPAIFYNLGSFPKTWAARDLLFVSTMAGVRLDVIKNRIYLLSSNAVRIMANTACAINKGSIGLSYECLKEPFFTMLPILLGHLGYCQRVDEDQLHAVCGLSGSGIAFVYSMIQAMSDAGVLVGLPRSLAINFVLQTIEGACEMVKITKTNPIELRDNVCSPAGTTIAGVKTLEDGRFNHTIMEAIKVSTERSKELSNLFI